jgi:integrase
MTDTSTHLTSITTGAVLDVAPTIDALTQAVGLVRQLVAAGIVTSESLGMPASSMAMLVPGQRITVRAQVERTLAGLPPATVRTYGAALKLLVDGLPAAEWNGSHDFPPLGDKWIDEVLTSELKAAIPVVRGRALLTAYRRSQRRQDADRSVRTTTGDAAVYSAIGAWRRLFSDAIHDRHLARHLNPALDLRKPARKGHQRDILTDFQLEQVLAIAGGTGDDPELDLLICETIIILGARQEGLLNLTVGGLDARKGTVRLDEKFGKVREQPSPDWLVAKLLSFAQSRGATRHEDKVFIKRPIGRRPAQPITPRRFNYLFTDRIQARLSWADSDQITAHALRHHAIKVVERAGGTAVSVTFAGHEPETVNGHYARAKPHEVAAVVCTLYGGTHPLLSETEES